MQYVSDPMNPASGFALRVLFLLSGATGLVYEIVWMRQLILVFGSTTYAVAAVLSAFMLGLALGSFGFGRAAERGVDLVRLYGLLEIGVGLYALVAPTLLGAAPTVARALSLEPGSGFLSVLLRLLLAMAVLLPPTILMGGTLPVLSRIFSSQGDDPSRPVGGLYAINTFGAVMGTFLAGFVLLPGLGARRATLATAAANILLGLAALAMSAAMKARKTRPLSPLRGRSGRSLTDRVEPVDPASQPDSIQASRSADAPASAGPLPVTGDTSAGAPWPRRSSVLIVFALSGFAAMVFEVAWSRLLSQTIGSSVYGFTLMLIAFLIGLSSGAAAFSRIAMRTAIRPGLALSGVLACVGIAAWLSSLLFGWLPYWFSLIFSRTQGAAGPMLLGEFGLCLFVMLPATFFMGGVFPLVMRLHARGSRAIAARVGEAYAANTTGTVLGSAVCGFLLLPLLGIRSTLIVASSMSLLLAAWMLYESTRGRRVRLAVPVLSASVIAAFLVLTPPWDPLMMNAGLYYHPDEFPEGPSYKALRDSLKDEEVVYYREGMTASVLVGRTTQFNDLYLKVNGKTEASSAVDLETQIFVGHLPLLLHDDPKKVLVIGLASGITVGSVSTHPVDSIRVLEVEPAMVEACRLFAPYNHNILEDPRVRVSITDARNDLLLRDNTYDVIVSEPSNPWMTVASNLFTRDFFELAKSRLNEDGIFGQWFQLYSMGPSEVRSLIATFRSVFPHVLVFRVGISSDLELVGSRRPLTLHLGDLARKTSDLDVAVDLGRAGILRVEDFLPYLYLTSPGLETFARGAPLNTDDNARIEFNAPLNLYAQTGTENIRQLARQRVRVTDVLEGIPTDPGARREMYLNLSESLFRLQRYWGASQALESAEEILKDARSVRLRDAINAQRSSS